ncbi:hypothetical protein B0H13DRAFT_41634 [Mycena leptocephala]|nr:hypothetical protein B0H13DRAFT_41634 [Mycena leptocephala]
MAQDRSVLDKSDYSMLLAALLFENLVRRLTDEHPLDHSIANDIVIKVAQIAEKISFRVERHWDLCGNAGYRFCALPNVSQEAILSALRLVRIPSSSMLRYFQSKPGSFPTGSNLTWLYRILESLGNSDGTHVHLIGGLWQALFLCRSDMARKALPRQSIRVLLSVLATDEEDSTFDEKEAQRFAYPACGVLDSADHWFADNELLQILQ